MQIEEINLIKGLHEILPHAAKRRVVQIAVVGDEGQHTLASLFNAPLPPAQELHIVVLQPFWVALAERFAIAEIIIADKLGNPFARVRAVAGVRRVAQDDEHRFVFLYLVGGVGLVAQGAQRAKLFGSVFQVLQRVREKDVDTLVALRRVAPLLAEERLLIHRRQRQADLEMRHRVRRHQEFKSKEPGQQMFVNVTAPLPGVLPGLKLRANESQHGVKKRCRPGSRVENEHAMRLVADLLFAFLALDGDLLSVGQSFLDAELVFQEAVDALDDVVHHRLGRVIDAPQFAQLGVVGLQESFVEVNDRIAAAALFAKVFHHPRHVRVVKCLDQILDEPGKRLIVQGRARDLLEERAEKGIRARDELLRLLASELAAAAAGAGAE